MNLYTRLWRKFELTLSLRGANIKGAIASAIIGNVIDRTQTSLDTSKYGTPQVPRTAQEARLDAAMKPAIFAAVRMIYFLGEE